MFGMLSSACITIARKGNQPQSPVDIIQCRHPNLLIGCHSSNCLLFKAVIFSYIVSALLMNINQEIQYFYWGARNFLVSHFLTGSSYSFRHRQAKMTLSIAIIIIICIKSILSFASEVIILGKRGKCKVCCVFNFPSRYNKSFLIWALPLNNSVAVWAPKTQVPHTDGLKPILRKSFIVT